MPSRIYNAQSVAGLVTEFELKGKFDPKLDETVVPIVIIADVRGEGPLPDPIYAFSFAIAPVAANRAIIEFRGAPGFICLPVGLIVEQAAVFTYTQRFDGSGTTPLFDGDVAAIGVADKIPHAGSPVLVHAGTLLGNAVGAIVRTQKFGVALGTSLDLRGWELDENDGLTLQILTVNTAATFSALWQFRPI